MKIGKLIYGKVTGFTEIKALGARVRLTFDSVTNANTCLSDNPLKSDGFTASIPSTLVYSLVRIKVSPSIRSPVQCGNCLRFGHTGRFCRSKPRCSHCSEANHKLLSCPTATSTDPTGFYCKGSHISSDRNCPEWIKQKKINKIMAVENVSFPEAVQFNNNNRVIKLTLFLKLYHMIALHLMSRLELTHPQ
ncbi:Nucleic-acid-binding protein from mobile element jockey [Aphis craccivora]|uniref:Nucleic-acid-binding protein from mobile element jockey n=1 Tax=Aphis craccivora TaxID=307492 RepID=A0A6G0YEB9_APHCR|nr:Nucleic-acid-binding protein from mobile element jockey [Aphis craccivora]